MGTPLLLPRWLLATLAGLALVLAGCGGDDDDAAASPDDPVAEQADNAEAAATEDDDPGDAAVADAALGWQLVGEPGR